MGAALYTRNKGAELSTVISRFDLANPRVEIVMEDREKISTGPNEEPINETIAGTGPGIPDDALAPGEDLPEPPTDEEVEEAAEALGAPTARKERDTLPLEGE